MSSTWTCDANEATCLRLAGAPAPCDRVFHPTFTYPIFGEAETIFGYQQLKIELSLASGSLAPCLQVRYRAKNTKTTAHIDDPAETLREFLPDDLVAPDAWDETVRRDARTFVPPGTKLHSYTRKAREFSIFHATWDTPGFRAWHERARIMTLFFIEGASYIDDDEAHWEFYTVFERVRTDDGDTWHFVGYTSLYRFWCWPDQTRLRLSQFLVLPPYQAQGHGSALYEFVYEQALNDPRICELTVEDPSEAFDHLRDTCDLRRLAADPAMAKVQVPALDQAARARYKLAPRQWARVGEMLALLRLGQDAESCRAYRLQVKARLYRVNREVLEAMPREQRLEKLHETFESVMDEYAELTGVELPPRLLEVGSGKRAASSWDALSDLPSKAPRFT